MKTLFIYYHSFILINSGPNQLEKPQKNESFKFKSDDIFNPESREGKIPKIREI